MTTTTYLGLKSLPPFKILLALAQMRLRPGIGVEVEVEGEVTYTVKVTEIPRVTTMVLPDGSDLLSNIESTSWSQIDDLFLNERTTE